MCTNRSVIAVLVLAATTLLAAQQAPPVSQLTPIPSYAEPGISPDGKEIAFVSGGDIWTVPSTGGDAHLLVADEGFKSRPLFSPDGQSLAFVSTRTGGGDIYVLSFASGAVRRLTMDDGLEQLDNWSRDGKWIYFESTARDISGMNDIYRVASDGGTPMLVSDDRYVNEFQAAPSPDGKEIAFAARGVASSQWWRRGGSHLDQSEIDLMKLDGPPNYERVSFGVLASKDGQSGSALSARLTGAGRNEWPMWDHTGEVLYYVNNEGAVENLVVTTPARGRDHSSLGSVTNFKDGRLLFPSITLDGKTIAFERDFGIWTVDTKTKQAHAIPITRRGTPTMPLPEHRRQTNQFEDLALSPDGKKIAFIARGDVFAASAKDAGDATRVTNTPAVESEPVWAPDSRRLVYASTRDDARHLYLYDFVTNREVPLTSGAGEDYSPAFSPDGKRVAFLRDGKDLRVVDVDSKQETSLAHDRFGMEIDEPQPAWSPDGKWIAVFAVGEKGFTNVSLIPSAGGTPRPVSSLANANANSIAWGHDGSFLLFDTSQRTELGQLARVDLVPRTPKYREDQFRDLFQEQMKPARPSTDTPPASAPAPAAAAPVTPATSKPASVEPVFEDIRRRLTLLPIGLDVQAVSVSPDGKTALLTAVAAGETNLYTYSLDDASPDRPVARQLTSTAGGKNHAQFSPDSKEVFYLENGRIGVVALDRREARTLAVTAELTVDFAVEKNELFEQAWTLTRDSFFDPKFNGVDWNAERARFAPHVAGATSPDELRRLLRLMVGDLNASHLGVTGPNGAPAAIGKLGLRFDRQQYEVNGRLKITSVLPLAPAALSHDIAVGDLIVSVNGRPIGPHVNLDELLADSIDKRVMLTMAKTVGGATHEVVVKPTNLGTEKALLYRDWVESNRAYVLAKSGGRLGYVHLADMSAASLDQLFVDLDADNHKRDGVVIDIRNNNGGFINAYALDVFARQPYLRMGPRGLPEVPARSALGQRALESATILVTNQHSLSDAEDFSEGYRALKLGEIVGEPTAGWIIYTSNVRLFDGTTYRLPQIRIKAADGSDMELHPRPVDIEVSRPIGESLTGKDSQLDAAISALLKHLGREQ